MGKLIVTYEPDAGEHIVETCKTVACLASERDEAIPFRFNDTDGEARPGENAEIVFERWRERRERTQKLDRNRI